MDSCYPTIDERASGGRVAAAVSRLVGASEHQVHAQLRRALGDSDLTEYSLLLRAVLYLNL